MKNTLDVTLLLEQIESNVLEIGHLKNKTFKLENRQKELYSLLNKLLKEKPTLPK